MNRAVRIAAITLALAAIGSLLGALAGMAALSLAAWASADGMFALEPGLALYVAAVIGGVLGGAGLPVAAWLLLRHVALGMIFALSVAGTIAGGVLGWLLRLGGDEAAGGLRGAAGGFIVAAVAMWLAARRKTKTARIEPA